MTPQDHDKNHRDSLEVKWITILVFLLGIFSWGYMTLDSRKLDKAVFEEASRNMTDMRDDLRAIRKLMDNHAFGVVDGGRR